MRAEVQKNICESYSKSEQEAVNFVTRQCHTCWFLGLGREKCVQ